MCAHLPLSVHWYNIAIRRASSNTTTAILHRPTTLTGGVHSRSPHNAKHSISNYYPAARMCPVGLSNRGAPKGMSPHKGTKFRNVTNKGTCPREECNYKPNALHLACLPIIEAILERIYESSTLGQGGRTCKQRVSGIHRHKSRLPHSVFTAYLPSRIKMRHLRSEDREETASVTLYWLFQGPSSCPT